MHLSNRFVLSIILSKIKHFIYPLKFVALSTKKVHRLTVYRVGEEQFINIQQYREILAFYDPQVMSKQNNKTIQNACQAVKRQDAKKRRTGYKRKQLVYKSNQDKNNYNLFYQKNRSRTGSLSLIHLSEFFEGKFKSLSTINGVNIVKLYYKRNRSEDIEIELPTKVQAEVDLAASANLTDEDSLRPIQVLSVSPSMVPQNVRSKIRVVGVNLLQNQSYISINILSNKILVSEIRLYPYGKDKDLVKKNGAILQHIQFPLLQAGAYSIEFTFVWSDHSKVVTFQQPFTVVPMEEFQQRWIEENCMMHTDED